MVPRHHPAHPRRLTPDTPAGRQDSTTAAPARAPEGPRRPRTHRTSNPYEGAAHMPPRTRRRARPATAALAAATVL
ncbi:hypothetical protein MHW47_21515, partial [Streptomyces sp. OfavH-34-F]|uniref:hypothetical protein n=1 Tax=Streptomyces sp. OfavH-34-F TaxID=2917760 RepID=UPI001EF33C9F